MQPCSVSIQQPSHCWSGSCGSSCHPLLCLCLSQEGVALWRGQWPLHWSAPGGVGDPAGSFCVPVVWHWVSVSGVAGGGRQEHEVPHGCAKKVKAVWIYVWNYFRTGMWTWWIIIESLLSETFSTGGMNIVNIIVSKWKSNQMKIFIERAERRLKSNSNFSDLWSYLGGEHSFCCCFLVWESSTPFYSNILYKATLHIML